MKVLSVPQPWAWAVLYAGKRVENRTWYTPYRGEVFIHADLRVDYDTPESIEEAISRVPQPRPPAYCGALIGRAMLVDCVRARDVPASQREWGVGPWCFVLDDVRPLARPISTKGPLGFFLPNRLKENVA